MKIVASVSEKEESVWDKQPPFLVVSGAGSIVLVSSVRVKDNCFSGVLLVDGVDTKVSVGSFVNQWCCDSFSLSHATVTLRN